MRDDGTWSIWFEGPPDLSTSIEAYVALRMAGVDPGPRALEYIRREGGIPKSRLFTKCFLALLGQWPWQRMVPIPPELILFPPSGAVLGLQLRVLGAADVRRARARAVAAARAGHRRRPARDRRDPRQDARAAQAERAPAQGAGARRAVDPRAAGGRRLVGRHPAAVGVGDHRAERARQRLRGPDAAQRRRGLAGLHGRGRRPAAPGGVPVARVGHRPRGARAARVRRAGRPSAARPRRRVPPLAGGHGEGRLGDPRARPRSGRLGVRVRERPLSRHRRRRRHLARAAAARPRRRRGRRAASTGSSACSREAAAGARSTSTTRRCGSTRSRSATSAR